MKKIHLMVLLSVLVVMLSTCAGSPLTGTRVELMDVAPPLSANWPPTTPPLNLTPNNEPAVYTFVVSNNGHVSYYGGIWVISIPGSAPRTYQDRQDTPIPPGQARRVVVSVPRGDITGVGSGATLTIPLSHPMGMAMWRDIRAHGIEKVSVRISSFDPE
jgi:hypothetical protein